MRDLRHPHVIRLLDVFDEEFAGIYLVQEYAEVRLNAVELCVSFRKAKTTRDTQLLSFAALSQPRFSSTIQRVPSLLESPPFSGRGAL